MHGYPRRLKGTTGWLARGGQQFGFFWKRSMADLSATFYALASSQAMARNAARFYVTECNRRGVVPRRGRPRLAAFPGAFVFGRFADVAGRKRVCRMVAEPVSAGPGQRRWPPLARADPGAQRPVMRGQRGWTWAESLV